MTSTGTAVQTSNAQPSLALRITTSGEAAAEHSPPQVPDKPSAAPAHKPEPEPEPEPDISFYDEIEFEDMEYDEEQEEYTYPCPCGDRFCITKSELESGEYIARCPACSLIIRVIYDFKKGGEGAGP